MEPLILFALGLAFVNGLNDASYSIATVVANRALSPAKAIFLTAVCNNRYDNCRRGRSHAPDDHRCDWLLRFS